MKENLNDLRTFLLVAQSGSFTKAAAQLGVSQSALSHAVRALEERLKIKLLHRTTRSMSTTEAGERLYQRLLPLFDHIDQEICDVRSAEGGLTGHLRINGRPLAVVDTLAQERLGGRLYALDLAHGGGPAVVGRVPVGHLLVMGDARGNSLDGRMFGLVPADAAYARAVAVYWRRGDGPVWQQL